MPFAWTAIHFIDIINGVAHSDPGTATSTEKDTGVSTGSQRKVRIVTFKWFYTIYKDSFGDCLTQHD